MNRLYLCVLALLIAMCSKATDKQALILQMHSGAEIVYLLDQEPTITFDDQAMVVSIADESNSIPMTDVKAWTIGLAEAGIQATIGSAETRIVINGQNVSISNPANCPIAVFRIDGSQAAPQCSGDASLRLAPGLYIITIGQKSYKISIL